MNKTLSPERQKLDKLLDKHPGLEVVILNILEGHIRGLKKLNLLDRYKIPAAKQSAGTEAG